MPSKILLISTGGTIAMLPTDNGGIAPALTGEDLLKAIPCLGTMASIDVVSFSSKPGASLTIENIIEISKILNEKLKQDYEGAIIVQGTDTIEETAFALDLITKNAKPIIVVGAMRGAQALSADGPANLLAAIIAASSPAAKNSGVLVVLNDEIHAARYVVKSDTSLTNAFSSPYVGPIARIIEGKYYPLVKITKIKPINLKKKLLNNPVLIIKVGLGDDGRLFSVIPKLGYGGVVIEAMGAGHLPEWYAEHISMLTNKMPVVLSTRVNGGAIFTKTYSFPGSEIDSIKRGMIPGGWITSVKASILLRFLLNSDISLQNIKEEYIQRANGY